ncbi:MAG: D-alanine--poly(phosphoribitol) ligase, partial [Atopobiaceae bacterium]|nr:D-alanine--poly(phosphoribitol) ligase [Atopobiaceae bacterium]
LRAGIDVGSTTVKLAILDKEDNVLWSIYQRHHSDVRATIGQVLEAAAQAVDGVERACCLYDSQRKRLHLVYVGPLDKTDLSTQLKETLPQYMVPNRIHQIDSMPLTKNGKVDRRALEDVCKIRR